MTSNDLSAVVAELAAIRLMLYAIGALVVVSVVLSERHAQPVTAKR